MEREFFLDNPTQALDYTKRAWVAIKDHGIDVWCEPDEVEEAADLLCRAGTLLETYLSCVGKDTKDEKGK